MVRPRSHSGLGTYCGRAQIDSAAQAVPDRVRHCQHWEAVSSAWARKLGKGSADESGDNPVGWA